MNLKLVRESTDYGNLDARLELLDAVSGIGMVQ
jgi:hypothetical protein